MQFHKLASAWGGQPVSPMRWEKGREITVKARQGPCRTGPPVSGNAFIDHSPLPSHCALDNVRTNIIAIAIVSGADLDYSRILIAAMLLLGHTQRRRLDLLASGT